MYEETFQNKTDVVSCDRARTLCHQIYLNSDQIYPIKLDFFSYDLLFHQLV